MSGKCIITTPQDNQSKPSNVFRTQNFTQHNNYMNAEPRRHSISWADL